MSAEQDREIVSTRVFDAPRERVFNAWTDAEQLAQWWGPKGVTITFQEVGLRPGGAWRYFMHGPDGVDYRNKSVVAVLVKPERIVREQVTGPRFTLTATCAEEAGATRLTWHMRFATAREYENAKGFVAQANEENLDRLAAHLASL